MKYCINENPSAIMINMEGKSPSVINKMQNINARHKHTGLHWRKYSHTDAKIWDINPRDLGIVFLII